MSGLDKAHQEAIKFMVGDIKRWSGWDNILDRIKSSWHGCGDKYVSCRIVPLHTDKLEIVLDMKDTFIFNTDAIYKEALLINSGQMAIL